MGFLPRCLELSREPLGGVIRFFELPTEFCDLGVARVHFCYQMPGSIAARVSVVGGALDLVEQKSRTGRDLLGCFLPRGHRGRLGPLGAPAPEHCCHNPCPHAANHNPIREARNQWH